jgi:hypothetical protein
MKERDRRDQRFGHVDAPQDGEEIVDARRRGEELHGRDASRCFEGDEEEDGEATALEEGEHRDAEDERLCDREARERAAEGYAGDPLSDGYGRDSREHPSPAGCRHERQRDDEGQREGELRGGGSPVHGRIEARVELEGVDAAHGRGGGAMFGPEAARSADRRGASHTPTTTQHAKTRSVPASAARVVEELPAGRPGMA